MCGIAGVIGGAAGPALVERMLAAIGHRGDPEFFGEMALTPLAAIGTNRLAIVDPQAGRQPVYDEPAGLWCVMNGEVYNHAALRRELDASHRFRTRCDTEVVLAAYKAWGEDFVNRFDGMFALCLVDAPKGRVLLARDPAGIKPLWLAERPGGLAFCSEAKGLAGLPHVDRIAALPPGSVWTNGTVRTYYSPPVPVSESDESDETLLERLRAALASAVGRCLPDDADEPVACLLSGGIDSSTVLYLAARARPGRVRAFTFSVPDGPSTDLEAARLVCDHLGVTLTVVSPTAAELCAFYLGGGVNMVETFEPALVRNAVSYHVLCRAVRAAGFKWCLSGEGADELFGGYDYFQMLPAMQRDAAIHASLAAIHRTYLQMADRASMAARVEVRVPYMERSLIDAAAALPSRFRIRGNRDKWGLRNLFPGGLPAAVCERSKTGMNQGAGFGGNDPGESIYSAAVTEFYRRHPRQLDHDLTLCAGHTAAYSLDLANREEVYNFARFVEGGLLRLADAAERPQLNTRALRAPAG